MIHLRRKKGKVRVVSPKPGGEELGRVANQHLKKPPSREKIHGNRDRRDVGGRENSELRLKS